MNLAAIEQLFEIAKRKNKYDKSNLWANGSETYLEEVLKEVQEVTEEIPLKRQGYLEEELGDVLWDYLNILLCLESEENIDISKVFERAQLKFDERITAIENGTPWAEIEVIQKERLQKEHET